MYGYVYLTTNLVNGKKYIGMHKSSEFDPEYKGSGKLLQQAISKYGWNNFKVEILQECESAEDLGSSEARIIEELDACNSKEFYNIKQGGFGGWKIGNTSIKAGVTVSEEGRRNISLAHQGKLWTEERKAARRELYIGKRNPFYGKDFSPEVKARLSEIRRGRVWINNGKSETTCSLEDLEEYISKGFCRGRLSTSCATMKAAGSFKFKWMTKDNIDCKARLEDVNNKLSEGWKLGRLNGCRRATTIENTINEKDIN